MSMQFPSCWYFQAKSSEVKNGAAITRKICGKELIIMRSDDGTLGCFDAYCSHNGAHLGKSHPDGVIVRDNLVVCPFHGYAFDVKGELKRSGYKDEKGEWIVPKSCEKGNLKSYPVMDKNGFIAVWMSDDPKAEPYEIDDWDMSEWSEPVVSEIEIPVCAEEINENSVDLGHFPPVHSHVNPKLVDHYFDIDKYVDLDSDELEVTNKATVEDHLLKVQFRMSQEVNAGPYKMQINLGFKTVVYGQGLSHVDARLYNKNMKMKYLIMCTPVEENFTVVRLASYIPKSTNLTSTMPFMFWLPHGVSHELQRKLTQHLYVKDVKKDWDIWCNKVYKKERVLCPGDGPLNTYRKYCKTFY